MKIRLTKMESGELQVAVRSDRPGNARIATGSAKPGAALRAEVRKCITEVLTPRPTGNPA